MMNSKSRPDETRPVGVGRWRLRYGTATCGAGEEFGGAMQSAPLSRSPTSKRKVGDVGVQSQPNSCGDKADQINDDDDDDV